MGLFWLPMGPELLGIEGSSLALSFRRLHQAAFVPVTPVSATVSVKKGEMPKNRVGI